MANLTEFVRHLARIKVFEYDFQDIVDEAEKSIVSEEHLPYSSLQFDASTATMFVGLLSRRSAKILRSEISRGAERKLVKKRFDRLRDIIFSLDEEIGRHGVVVPREEIQAVCLREFQNQRMDYLFEL